MGNDSLATHLRNVAIIAHVDHGKTTLVDGLLKQSNVFRDPDAAGELIMDANDLERERGITILAKNTAIFYEGVKINIIDTPGHADFGGEVERVLNMADGCLLLVDAVEGHAANPYGSPTGTRDRIAPDRCCEQNRPPRARAGEVVELTQDLFLDLASDAEQLEFPVIYTIAREGRAGYTPDEMQEDLRPLLDTILSSIPAPAVDVTAPAQLLVASLDFDTHRGRVAIGRIHRGTIHAGDSLLQIDPDGQQQRQRISTLETFAGLKRREIEEASAGDIVAICGFADAKIGATLTDPSAPDALAPITIEEPTLKLSFGVNTSPYAGREAKYSTSRQLRSGSSANWKRISPCASNQPSKLTSLRSPAAANCICRSLSKPCGAKAMNSRCPAPKRSHGRSTEKSRADRALADRHCRALRRHRHRVGRRSPCPDVEHGQRWARSRSPRIRHPNPRTNWTAQCLSHRHQGQRCYGLPANWVRAVLRSHRLAANRRAGRLGNGRFSGKRYRQRARAGHHLH